METEDGEEREETQDGAIDQGEDEVTNEMDLGGSFTLSGTSFDLKRMGYGAMQLAGPQVWGPPRDMDTAMAVLRQAVAPGSTTSIRAITTVRM